MASLQPTEYTARIYSDDGYYYEIGPDPDGLGLIHLRYVEPRPEGNYEQGFSMLPDHITELAETLLQIGRLNKAIS